MSAYITSGGGGMKVIQVSSSSTFDNWTDPQMLLGNDWPAGLTITTLGGDQDIGKIRYKKGWKAPELRRKDPPKIVRIRSQKFEDIRKACLEQGALWEDPDFPANDRSVYYSYSPGQSFEWRRPTEICEEPRMFVGGASRFDIVQGDLGNCWFLAALASMCASKEGLIEKIISADNVFTKDYVGAFHFKIWQYGRWIDVCIDDRLPTLNGRLVFVHSANTNEFWSALLEKAYAKINGSYEAMVGGCAAEAMEDFTGGLCETFKLTNPKKLPPDLFTVMRKASERSSLLGCTIDAAGMALESELPNGLIIGHAYSITDVKQVELIGNQTEVYGRKENLIRIRNPWGNQYEWKGAWGDNSNEWKMLSDADRERLDIRIEDDGEFWMTFNDFMSNFHNLEICHLDPTTLSEESAAGKRKWEMTLHEGCWRRRVNAGGCRNFLDTFWTNPQYYFEVVDPDEGDDDNMGSVIIAVMQKETRRKKQMTGQDLLTMGYMIYKVKEPNPEPLDMNFFKYNGSAGKSTFTNMREVVGRHKLEPGHYVIIPCTFQPNEEGDFIVRIFTEKAINSSEVDEETGILEDHDPQKVKKDIPIHINVPAGEETNKHTSTITIKTMKAEPERRRRRAQIVTEDDVNDEKTIRELFKKTAGEDLEVDAFELRGILNSHFQKEFTFDGFSKETARSMLAMLDIDHSGKLQYQEFKNLWTELRKWKKIFKEFDKDKSGTFNSYELRDALNSTGFRVSNSTFRCLVMRYSDRNGKIFFDDFVLCAVKMKTMCDVFKEMCAGGNTANFCLDEFIQTTMYA